MTIGSTIGFSPLTGGSTGGPPTDRYSRPSMQATTAATVFTAVACGVLGLVVGSFLNVVVFRLPRAMSIVRPPSSCPRCGAALLAWDNVPVLSWVVLRGRCRSCAGAISVRYPLIELTTGVGFGCVGWALGPSAALAPVLLIVAAIIAASTIDHDRLPIPAMVLVAQLTGVVGLVAVSLADHGASRIGWGVLGAVATALATAVADARSGRPKGQGAVWPAMAASMLGFSAGWLWPAGGLLCALWSGLAVLATRLKVDGRWLVATTLGSYLLLAIGAATHGP